MNHTAEELTTVARPARRSPAMHHRGRCFAGSLAETRLEELPQSRQDYMLRAYFSQCVADARRDEAQRLGYMLARTAGDVRTLASGMGNVQRDQELASQLADLRRGIDEADRRTAALLRETNELIDQLSDPLLQTILRCRYLHHMNLSEVAQQIHYCQRHVARLHDQALAQLNLPHIPRLR